MCEDSIKNKTVKGVFWSGVDKFAYYAIQFVVNIIMARLLTPNDYGLVGIMMVFIAFSGIFVDGGFMTALIQKKDRNETDFNTVFVTNTFTAVILCGLLFLVAPLIASYYSEPSICGLLRVLSLQLIISALGAVSLTKLTIEVDFKSIAIASITAAIISGVTGIAMAYNGYGVWSLVYMQLILISIRSLLLNLMKKWMPSFSFSISSFKQLFSFSSKLIASSLVDQIYLNLYPLVIGKYFSTRSLGIYTRGEQFGKMPASILNDMFMRVTLPIMSSVQDDIPQLRRVYREYIQASSFIIFGIMCLLIVIAHPLILLLLKEQWLESVPVMQILCAAMMTLHISAINRNLLYAKGYSGWALRLELIKKGLAIVLFILSLPFGVIGVCVGQFIYSIFAPFINSYYTKILIGISYWEQFLDYGKIWIIAIIAGVIAYCIMLVFLSPWLQLASGSLFFCVMYLGIHMILKTPSYKMFMNIVKRYI